MCGILAKKKETVSLGHTGEVDMPPRRRKFDPALKARIALEAVRGRISISALAEQYAMHPNQIHAWKKQLQDQAVLLFERRFVGLSPRAPIANPLAERESGDERSRGSPGQGGPRPR